MNRPVSFVISLIGHVLCVGLLLLTAKPASDEPIMMEVCRVNLLAPGRPGPPGPLGPPASVPPKPAAPPPTVKKTEPAPDQAVVIRQAPRWNPRPKPERLPDLAPLKRLEKETLPQPPRELSGERTPSAKLSVLSGGNTGYSGGPGGGGSYSYDAVIASVVKSNWVRPSRVVVGENPPSVSISIRIAGDGAITRRQIAHSSGIGPLDSSAIKAIDNSNPLPLGLPSYIRGRYYDVTIVFEVTDEA
ncbi:MAG: TonB family protein [bacterium]|nr:TonB family protein [bacterium]